MGATSCAANRRGRAAITALSFLLVGQSGMSQDAPGSYPYLDTTPPTIYCPPDKEKEADGCDTSAYVYVGKPTATDNKDPDPTILPGVRSDGKALSDPYPIGVTTIKWTAKDSANNKSHCTQTVTVTAGDCPDTGDNCTYTQGYWKNHPDEWPVASLNLGSVNYTKAQLLSILNQPVQGNGLVLLSRQLIAAKLNIANGADPDDIADKIAAADALIGSKAVPPVGTDSVPTSDVSAIADMIAMYNEGVIGPGHCDEEGDEDPCEIECPEDICVEADPGECSAVVEYDVVVIGDCGDSAVVCDFPSGHEFPVGKTKVTCRVESASGAAPTTYPNPDPEPDPVVECCFEVVVKDTEKPVLDCPEDICVGTDYGKCEATVTYDVVFSDNCTDICKVECDLPSGHAFPVGDTTVKCKATDEAGNTSYCEFDVKVKDEKPPVLDCCADIDVCVPAGDCEVRVDYDVKVRDNCSSDVKVRCYPPSGSLFPVGVTIVKCTAEDASGNKSYCTFKVRVTDKSAPDIDCPDDICVYADPGKCTAVVHYDNPASDSCSSDVQMRCYPPSGSPFPVGVTIVKCVAQDASGNKSYCTFKVTVKDTTAPDVKCPYDITVCADPGKCDAKVSFELKAWDKCSSATVWSYPASGSRFKVGKTLVKVTAQDSSGNRSYCQFYVTVTDKNAPDITCPQDITVCAQYGRCDAVVRYYVKAWDACCGPVNVVCDPPSGSRFPVGVTEVKCVATDTSGNKSYCKFKVRVLDKTAPDITCPRDIYVKADGCNKTADVNCLYPKVRDNCDLDCKVVSVVRSDGKNLSDPFKIGTTYICWTASDSSGNKSKCWSKVVVAKGNCYKY